MTLKQSPTQLKLARRAFTLIELLVVMSIISVMVAVLLPAVNAVRETARRSNCLANLRQVGLAMEQYLDIHKRYPTAAQVPSVTPDVPSLSDLLATFAENNREVFACPSDAEFYSAEGISYEYPSFRLAEKTRREIKKKRPLDTVWVAYDFDHFHGQASMEGARNVLYADSHVSSF